MNNPLLAALGIRPFLFLWLAEVCAQVAFNMVNFVMLIVVYQLTKSNTAVSLVVLSFTIPAIVFGMLAGVLVDRWTKKKVLFLVNIIRMVLVLLLIVFKTNLIFVYVISFAISTATQFFIPAESPMIPLVVPRSRLYAANALFGLAIYGSVLVAFLLASPILLVGSTHILAFIALLFLLAAVFVIYIKVPNREKETITKGAYTAISKAFKARNLKTTIGEEIKLVVNLIMRTKEIYHSLLLLALSQILTLLLIVVGPGYATDVLGINVESFPLLFMTPAALGMLFGAIVLINLFHTHNKQKSATIGVLLLGLTVMLLQYSPWIASKIAILDVIHLTVFFAFFIGFANALVYVPSNTILQEETSDKVRGKMYGVLNASVGIFSLFPIAVVGRLADVFGVGKVLLGISLGLITLGFVRLAISTRKKNK